MGALRTAARFARQGDWQLRNLIPGEPQSNLVS